MCSVAHAAKLLVKSGCNGVVGKGIACQAVIAESAVRRTGKDEFGREVIRMSQGVSHIRGVGVGLQGWSGRFARGLRGGTSWVGDKGG